MHPLDGIPLYEVEPADCDICKHVVEKADERKPPYFNVCTVHIAALRQALRTNGVA